jgi:hypothetical protein
LFVAENKGEIVASIPKFQTRPIPIDFDGKVQFLAMVTSEHINNRKHGSLRGAGSKEAQKVIKAHMQEVHNIGSPLANEYGSILVDPSDFVPM